MISVAFVFAATLIPAGGGDGPELRLDPTAGLDELQALGNVVLFMPLGGSLALPGVSRVKVMLVAAALSALVETLQYFLIEGRYAATGDVILNTIGAALGHIAVARRTFSSDV